MQAQFEPEERSASLAAMIASVAERRSQGDFRIDEWDAERTGAFAPNDVPLADCLSRGRPGGSFVGVIPTARVCVCVSVG